MAFVSYVARRQLIPGHVAGTEYELDIVLSGASRSFRRLGNVQQALAGNIETNFYGLVTVWSFETFPVPLNAAGQIIEFLASTADGQPFTIDPYGDAETEVEVLNVVRDDEGFEEARVMPTDGQTDFVQYRFTVRTV